MSSNDKESFRSFSYEDESAKARWYQDDLNAGGWREVMSDKARLGATFWVKTFPDEAIAVKTLMKFQLPMSAQQFADVVSPVNMELQQKWDKVFVDEVLEEYPDNGGHVIRVITKMPWPLRDRDFVIFVPPVKEVEWYGKKALLVVNINAWHPSRPANEGSCVRATNGGNFKVVVPDERDPDNACSVFFLSNNNANGWIPNWGWLGEKIAEHVVPKTFISYFENVVEGYKMFFESK